MSLPTAIILAIAIVIVGGVAGWVIAWTRRARRELDLATAIVLQMAIWVSLNTIALIISHVSAPLAWATYGGQLTMTSLCWAASMATALAVVWGLKVVADR